MLLIHSLLLFVLSTVALAGNQHYAWLPTLFEGPDYKMGFKDYRSGRWGSSTSLDALKKLVSKSPGLQTTFALVHTSQSLQTATKKEPRIIFFTPNGLFFSVDTHEKAHTIEVKQFNPKKSEFDFHEISFKDGSAKVERNAKSCFACHAGRPIWDSYHTWEGVYGSTDDYFFESRMSPQSLEERAELKEVIENNQNEFLKVIGLDEDDYPLENYPVISTNVYLASRRNTYLLYHLGYYNLLTLNTQSENRFSYNFSFLNPLPYFSFGSDLPPAAASRTKTMGLEVNPVYGSIQAVGNYVVDINVPKSHMETYQGHRKKFASLEKVYRKSPLAKCLACHNGNNPSAPVIPFNRIREFQKLAETTDIGKRILERIDPRYHGSPMQMPPTEILSEEERQSVIEYVKTFSKSR